MFFRLFLLFSFLYISVNGFYLANIKTINIDETLSASDFYSDEFIIYSSPGLGGITLTMPKGEDIIYITGELDSGTVLLMSILNKSSLNSITLADSSDTTIDVQTTTTVSRGTRYFKLIYEGNNNFILI